MSTTTADYYSVLGVPLTASQDEIRAAYRRMAKQFHPDVNPEGAERFRMATEAYQVLSDPEKRAAYDAGDADADDDGLTVEDLDAYFRAVRSILGDDELLDVGPVLLKLESGGEEMPTALGLLFVGPRAAVFVDSRARHGEMQGRVAPIHYSTLIAQPDLRSDDEGSVVRLYAHDDIDYVAYIVAAAPLLGTLQGAASAAFRASGGSRRASSPTRPGGTSSGSGISFGRIVRWILTALFILGLVGKLLTAMGASTESSTTSTPTNTDTGSVQEADPSAGSSTNTEQGSATPDLADSSDSWEAAASSFDDYAYSLGGEWSDPVEGSGDVTAVAVQADSGSLNTHVYSNGFWGSHQSLTPTFTDEVVGFETSVVDTTGQGGDDILITFDNDDGLTTGTVVFNNGEFANFTDSDGEYGFIDGLTYEFGELTATGTDGEPYLMLEYRPGQGTFELTEL